MSSVPFPCNTKKIKLINWGHKGRETQGMEVFRMRRPKAEPLRYSTFYHSVWRLAFSLLVESIFYSSVGGLTPHKPSTLRKPYVKVLAVLFSRFISETVNCNFCLPFFLSYCISMEFPKQIKASHSKSVPTLTTHNATFTWHRLFGCSVHQERIRPLTVRKFRRLETSQIFQPVALSLEERHFSFKIKRRIHKWATNL